MNRPITSALIRRFLSNGRTASDIREYFALDVYRIKPRKQSVLAERVDQTQTETVGEDPEAAAQRDPAAQSSCGHVEQDEQDDCRLPLSFYGDVCVGDVIAKWA